MGNSKGIIINGGNFTITNMINGNQINYSTHCTEEKKEETDRQWEVVFSFAGEQRELVREVAIILGAKKVSVFYDESEQIDLWGENLKDRFRDIFGFEGTFCVVFLSSHYLEKRWCQFERKIIEERVAKSTSGYILPISLDGTMIAEWEDHKAFLDGRNKSAQDIADDIFQKLYLAYRR